MCIGEIDGKQQIDTEDKLDAFFGRNFGEHQQLLLGSTSKCNLHCLLQHFAYSDQRRFFLHLHVPRVLFLDVFFIAKVFKGTSVVREGFDKYSFFLQLRSFTTKKKTVFVESFPYYLVWPRGFAAKKTVFVEPTPDYLGYLRKEISIRDWRQRGRVVRAPDLKSIGRGFKSRSDR